MNINKKEYLKVIEVSSVLLVSFSMLTYGIGKLIQFKEAYLFNSNKLVEELSGMDLMWTFYGYSFKFAVIIGLLEIIGAILIIVKKTRLLGCLLLSILLINIIIQDFIFEIPAIKSAILYQLLIIIIAVYNRKELILALKIILLKKSSIENKKLIYTLSILLFFIYKLSEVYLL